MGVVRFVSMCFVTTVSLKKAGLAAGCRQLISNAILEVVNKL